MNIDEYTRAYLAGKIDIAFEKPTEEVKRWG